MLITGLQRRWIKGDLMYWDIHFKCIYLKKIHTCHSESFASCHSERSEESFVLYLEQSFHMFQK